MQKMRRRKKIREGYRIMRTNQRNARKCTEEEKDVHILVEMELHKPLLQSQQQQQPVVVVVSTSDHVLHSSTASR